ncbi:hypothetical protein V2H77_01005 [Photorhabdus sp. P32]|uniref:hypothetical protein n=1 Tax=Photorhabdus sp. P32 TaxID=3117549 RepID=UPI00311B0AD9
MNIPSRIQAAALRFGSVTTGFRFCRLAAIRKLNANRVIRFFRFSACLIDGFACILLLAAPQ